MASFPTTAADLPPHQLHPVVGLLLGWGLGGRDTCLQLHPLLPSFFYLPFPLDTSAGLKPPHFSSNLTFSSHEVSVMENNAAFDT